MEIKIRRKHNILSYDAGHNGGKVVKLCTDKAKGYFVSLFF